MGMRIAYHLPARLSNTARSPSMPCGFHAPVGETALRSSSVQITLEGENERIAVKRKYEAQQKSNQELGIAELSFQRK